MGFVLYLLLYYLIMMGTLAINVKFVSIDQVF